MAEPSADVELDPVVARIAAGIVVKPDGTASLPDDAFVQGAAAVADAARTLEPAKRIAAHLIALGLKAERLAPQGSAVLVAQLAVLCGIAGGGLGDGEAAFAAAGVQVDSAAQKAIGSATSRLPATGKKVEGALSPLEARTGKPSKK
jgi:hypothetical protein